MIHFWNLPLLFCFCSCSGVDSVELERLTEKDTLGLQPAAWRWKILDPSDTAHIWLVSVSHYSLPLKDRIIEPTLNGLNILVWVKEDWRLDLMHCWFFCKYKHHKFVIIEYRHIQKRVFSNLVTAMEYSRALHEDFQVFNDQTSGFK